MPTIIKKSIQNDAKINKKSIEKSIQKWVGFWSPKWNQNGSRNWAWASQNPPKKPSHFSLIFERNLGSGWDPPRAEAIWSGEGKRFIRGPPTSRGILQYSHIAVLSLQYSQYSTLTTVLSYSTLNTASHLSTPLSSQPGGPEGAGGFDGKATLTIKTNI